MARGRARPDEIVYDETPAQSRSQTMLALTYARQRDDRAAVRLNIRLQHGAGAKHVRATIIAEGVPTRRAPTPNPTPTRPYPPRIRNGGANSMPPRSSPSGSREKLPIPHRSSATCRSTSANGRSIRWPCLGA